MIKMTRRAALVGGGIAPFVGRRAQAAEFSYKWATDLESKAPGVIRAKEATDAIREKSGGRLDIRVFPDSQLGNGPEMLSQVRSGGIEFFPVSDAVGSTLVPASSISAVGFAFQDSEHVWKAMDGSLGAYVRAQYDKTRGLTIFEKIWENGFRQITSGSRVIGNPDDLKGFKIRVPPSPLYTSMFAALGASPTAIPFTELYTALQTRLVDGQENPLGQIKAGRIFEVQKYCALTNHMWSGFWIVANRRAWERLPADLRALASEHINQAGLLVRKDLTELNGQVPGGPDRQGHDLQPSRSQRLPGCTGEDGFLRDVEKELRIGGVGDLGAERRQAGVIVPWTPWSECQAPR